MSAEQQKPASVDQISSRNSTRIYLIVNGQRVGRVQSVDEQISNNVQVLNELGNAYAAELKKGVTTYSFTISRFYVRNDVIDSLKLGAVFSLAIRDDNIVADGGSGTIQSLEYFDKCMITNLSRTYAIGAATVSENASVVTIGKGRSEPVNV